jgi:hypothetical protein
MNIYERIITYTVLIVLAVVALVISTELAAAETEPTIPFIVKVPVLPEEGDEDETKGGTILVFHEGEWCRLIKDTVLRRRRDKVVSLYVCNDYAIRIVREVQ